MADGKKRSPVALPIGDDEDEARTVTTVQESRWLAGVTRQAEAQPTAQLHQQAASQAAAAKRTAEASFTAEEAKRRRADHMKEVRAQQKAERVAAAAAARVPDRRQAGSSIDGSKQRARSHCGMIQPTAHAPATRRAMNGRFRADRMACFLRVTGESLEGCDLAQQWQRADRVARAYPADTRVSRKRWDFYCDDV
jgi:uncharacterized protein YhaN